ncbi:MAG: thioredoxin-like domain-containing protein [Bacteroidota bacterium]
MRNIKERSVVKFLNKGHINLFTISLLIFLVNCDRDDANFQVEGRVKNGAGKYITLQELTTREVITMDSTLIGDNGEFSLDGNIDVVKFMTLNLDEKEPIYLVVSPGDDIHIKTTFDDFHLDYILDGSFDSKLIYVMITEQREAMNELDDLANVYREKIISANDKMAVIEERNEKRKAIIEDYREFTISFIRENPGSMASLMALYQYIDPKTPVLNPQDDFVVFALVDSVLTRKYPSSEAVKSLNRFMVKLDKQKVSVGVGDIAPEIGLPTPEGDTLLLSSIDAKYILIDFWAAWCPPCRDESPVLVEAYEEYNKNGFEIYQVSLDKTKDAWTTAIAKDNLGQWHHVSDLAYWDSYPARVYGVQQIPSNFLINADMEVIAIDLRGEQLLNRLDELFN